MYGWEAVLQAVARWSIDAGVVVWGDGGTARGDYESLVLSLLLPHTWARTSIWVPYASWEVPRVLGT